jgi:predicted pyridoxine 5'-phosphate oxidase superfamily flavin-nucleotide-binding protein
VKGAQAANGGAKQWSGFQGDRSFDRFTQSEAHFFAERDSLYMATGSSTGWSYIQHRGGPIGFLRVLDEKTAGFADLRGNQQYISVGNISAEDCTSVIDGLPKPPTAETVRSR